MRENFLPMLEANGVDLVLNGHSHSYERSYFLNGHYGDSDSFDSILHTAGVTGMGDGRSGGDGEYLKFQTGGGTPTGTVYITAGSSGKISGGSLDHEAMYASINSLGSGILNVMGDRLDLQFIDQNGALQDYFTIVKEATLPVDLSYFRGSVIEQTTWLSWKSNREIGHAGYEVQHSTDGQLWTALTYVEGSQQNMQGAVYEFAHLTTEPGMHFYRLKSIDLDGSEEYSELLSFKIAAAVELSISPNPANNYLKIQGKLSSNLVRITDFSGQHIGAFMANNGKIDVSQLKTGVHLITLQTDQGSISRHFVKH